MLPVPERYPPQTLSPQRQKQKMQEALVAWLLAEATQQPVLAVWKDLHWADPSTLELLGLLLNHVPTARLLLVLIARPEFHPPWAPRSYVTPLTLTRLTRPMNEEMALRVTGGGSQAHVGCRSYLPEDHSLRLRSDRSDGDSGSEAEGTGHRFPHLSEQNWRGLGAADHLMTERRIWQRI